LRWLKRTEAFAFLDTSSVRVRIFSSPPAAARALAATIARALTAHPRLVLGLPTGRTPIPLYRRLIALHRAGRASFSRATTFNLDEFVGIAPDDPGSYHAFMQRHLFDHVDLRPSRIQFLNGAAPDPGRECGRYERAIDRAGGIDLQILGLGTNGHIGFNEPASKLSARAHRATLTAATRRANAALFRNRPVPRQALSMGMATILRARRIVLLATGRSKARSVERLLRGPLTTRLPASFLQLHASAEIWLDRDAASRL
jgi:glucosamine-6-phosphate deaminase